jgi:hypothetical protein
MEAEAPIEIGKPISEYDKAQIACGRFACLGLVALGLSR